MGCDIHWIIERRAKNGRWYACASIRQFYQASLRHDADEIPGCRLGWRNYELFSALSGVRGHNDNPAMIRGVPADISQQVHAELEYLGVDAHSRSYALGGTIVSWQSQENEQLRAFSEYATKLLDAGGADYVLPELIFSESQHDLEFADKVGAESGHLRLERLRASREMIGWRENPDAWRILVFYDS